MKISWGVWRDEGGVGLGRVGDGGWGEHGEGRGEVCGGSWRTKERQSVIEPLSRVLAWRKRCENDIIMVK